LKTMWETAKLRKYYCLLNLFVLFLIRQKNTFG